MRAELPCSLLCWRCVWGQALTGEGSSSGYSWQAGGQPQARSTCMRPHFCIMFPPSHLLPSKRH